MTDSSDLYALKTAAKAAKSNMDRYMVRRRDWVVLYPIFCIPMLAMALLGLSRGFDNENLGLSLLRILSAIVPAAVLLVSLKKARVKSSKETLIIDTEKKASDAYLRALLTEANSYGVDMTTMALRSDILDDSLEFTALRKDNVVDISVREFRNEIVFMMNGERLHKDTARSRRFGLAAAR